MEELESITNRAHRWSDFDMWGKPRPHLFRIHCGIVLLGQEELHQERFWYHDFPAARRGYRNILLRLYRAKNLAGFAIALNRLGDPSGQKPMHVETGWAGDGDASPQPAWIAEIGNGSGRVSTLAC